MTRTLKALALAVALGLPAQAQEAPEAVIQGVIRSQIEAFLADDFATAFTFASPAIRGIFQTPETFGAMVRNGYPMVWRPEDVEFGELREIAGQLWQRVIVRDAEGRLHALDYQMVPGHDGWRINGVQLLQAPQVGA
ncbi:MAG: DUF4864 domain-containing protein [Paracoccaceae bacterium]|nr:DUF4864 domain-containing protein [Paracoccaceae bacterium]